MSSPPVDVSHAAMVAASPCGGSVRERRRGNPQQIGSPVSLSANYTVGAYTASARIADRCLGGEKCNIQFCFFQPWRGTSILPRDSSNPGRPGRVMRRDRPDDLGSQCAACELTCMAAT